MREIKRIARDIAEAFKILEEKKTYEKAFYRGRIDTEAGWQKTGDNTSGVVFEKGTDRVIVPHNLLQGDH